MLLWPVVSYWVLSIFYEVLDEMHSKFVDRHRIVRRVKGKGNAITKSHVVVRVLLQHLLQTCLGLTVVFLDPGFCDSHPNPGWLQAFSQFVLGMLIMDTWQYWIHRWMHVNTFLYKHLHSHHHRLIIPYACGALYNHPLEALLLDSVGAVVSQQLSGMACGVTVWFYAFSSCKTVLDHCGYRFPLNPLHGAFPNNAAYHDVHHDLRYLKKNFSQPFFTVWDIVCGTFEDPSNFHKEQGGSMEDTCLQQQADAASSGKKGGAVEDKKRK